MLCDRALLYLDRFFFFLFDLVVGLVVLDELLPEFGDSAAAS